jgi:acyl-CoA thioesterase FadM
MNSILVSVLTATDAFLCVLVVIAACDYLRRIRPIDHPLLSVSFYLVAIGAFGAFVTAIQGHWVNPFGVMLHAGVVVYALARRNHLFEANPVDGYQPIGRSGPVAPPPKNP